MKRLLVKAGHPHERLIKNISEEFRHILHTSEQGIFIYLDDEHKVCNEQFAKMVGYKSASEWSKLPTVLDDVMPGDQEKVISSYRQAVDHAVGSTIEVSLRKRNGKGKAFKANIILVPISLHGEIFALHFVTRK